MKNDSHIVLADQILADLEHAQKKLRARNTAVGLLLFFGFLFTAVLLLIVPERSLYLPAGVKTGYLLFVAGISVYIVYKFTSRIKTESLTQFYRDFCSTKGLENIENALDLYLDSDQKRSLFHKLAIDKNLAGYNESEWREKLNAYIADRSVSRRFHHSLMLFSVSLVLLLAAVTFLREPLNRSVIFWKTFEKPNPFLFTVSPGDVTLEHGTAFTPEVGFLQNREPGQVMFAFRTDIEEQYRYRPMAPAGDRVYTASPIEMTGNGSYFIEMDGFQSRLYDISVQFRPRFESLTATVVPPDYTGLPTATYSYPFARISVYAGSAVTLHAVSNKPVSDVQLHGKYLEDPLFHSPQTGPEFETVFTAETTDTLSFSMNDEDGLSNRNPFQFVMQVKEDQHPVVNIREPASDIQLEDPESVEIFYLADDDFGLTGAQLEWELKRAFASQSLEGSAALPAPAAGETERHLWNLAEMDLRPRDRLSVWISVRDNDGWKGFKTSWSQPLTISIPSITALLEEVGEQESHTQNRLDEITETYDQMEQAYEQFRRQMSQSTDPGWEEEQALESVQVRQQELEEATRQLNEEFEELKNNLENRNTVSDETRRAYRELQEVMENLEDPELRKALEELRESMESLSMMDLENAMENFEFNEQVYRERLEQTLELFKTLKMNSDLDKIARQYEDMATRLDSAGTGNTSPEQNREVRQSVREDMQTVENQLETLGSRPPERSRERLGELQKETLQELRELQQELDVIQKESDESSGGNENSASPGGNENPSEDENPSTDSSEMGADENEQKRPDTRERQESVARQLQQRANTLRNARQEMSNRQNQINLLALQRSLYSLIELSEAQEKLSLETGRTGNGSQYYVDLARKQNNINTIFGQVADTLSQIASEIPAISDNINRRKMEVGRVLSRTQQQLAERNQATSVTTSRESLGGVNELASMIASLIGQLAAQQQSGGMGSGMMTLEQMIEQMQGMSQNQQQLNRELEQLINDIQGERLSRGETERLEQLARQQNEIRRDLENLQRSGVVGQGDAILSEMQRAMEEMENTINDMRGGIADHTLVERQQNILSRMLNAEDSLQKRGEEDDEYAGSEAEEYQRAVPPDITMEELRQEIRAHLNDPDFTRFSDDYQQLIERYFELLRQFEDGPRP